MDKSAVIVVLPIPNAKSVEELIEFLGGYGQCFNMSNAPSGELPERTIVLGKITRELATFKSSAGDYKKVYYLASAAPGDTSACRFVAYGKRLISLIEDVFLVGVGDYLALYEPQIMHSAADLPTVYFNPAKATLWTCKMSPRNKEKVDAMLKPSTRRN